MNILNLNIEELQQLCYKRAVDAGWHTDLVTGKPKVLNDGEQLMLIVSEIAEGMEGLRKNLMDDKLPHRPMVEVEMADAIIRICHWTGYKGYDLAGAIQEKLDFNSRREDHKIENRIKENGKKF